MGKNDSIEFLEGVCQDVQKHLNILGKYDKMSIASYIASSRLPNIEKFMPSLEAELNERDLTDEEREQMAKEEEERIAKEKAEKEEQERLAAEKAEQERLEAERLEQERIAAEEAARKAEEERLAAEKAEQERLEAERIERERIAAEEAKKAEEERLAQEAEDARLEAERLEAEKAALEAEEKVKELEREKAEKEAQREAELEQLQKAQEAQEKARLRALEEEKAKKAEAKERPQEKEESISVISFDTLKNKNKPIAKKSTMISGGVSAAIAEAARQRAELDAIKKEVAQENAKLRKEEKEAEEAKRLPNAILIGNTKKASPELGKFEIALTYNIERPYKFVLKTELGKVVFETAPMKTKPNELTAIMFKDIMANGSFAFIKTPQGYNFKILDSRQRVFCVSKPFRTTLDAQKAAALVKKYGLSANYIDDRTV